MGTARAEVRLGDYALGDALGRGGMSTVVLGLQHRLQHPNVVAIRDVIRTDDELGLVMDVVEGPSLGALVGAVSRERLAPAVAGAIMMDVLRGLDAVHDARGERGAPLHMVHRDVSPTNILVARDGRARIADFGVAKAIGRLQQTREGAVKGKHSYMAPEQMWREDVTRTSRDVAGEVPHHLFHEEEALHELAHRLRRRAGALRETSETVLASGQAKALRRVIGIAVEPACRARLWAIRTGETRNALANPWSQSTRRAVEVPEALPRETVRLRIAADRLQTQARWLARHARLRSDRAHAAVRCRRVAGQPRIADNGSCTALEFRTATGLHRAVEHVGAAVLSSVR